MSDFVVREITIAAPPGRVWQALTDHREFGVWFGVDLDGPFVRGGVTRGAMTIAGATGLPFAAEVVAFDPPYRFAFRWPGWDFESGQSLADCEPWTLVEFVLEDEDGGTRVTVRESGFGRITAPLGERLRTENDHGWDIQLGRLASHLSGHVT